MAKEDSPKNIQIRRRANESPEFREWIANQSNASESIRNLIELQIQRYGTGDMSSMTIKMKMAQDELILSGMQVPTITPVPVSTVLVQETSPTTALLEKEVQEQKQEPAQKQEQVQEQPQKQRVIDRGESNL